MRHSSSSLLGFIRAAAAGGEREFCIGRKIIPCFDFLPKMFVRVLLVCSCLVFLAGNNMLAESARSYRRGDGGCRAVRGAVGRRGGGCIGVGVQIRTMAAGGRLLNRINNICNGLDRQRRPFGNTWPGRRTRPPTRCLPCTFRYLEFRLTPGVGDTHRIVQQRNSNVFYYTPDHYCSFFRINNIHGPCRT